MLSRINAAAAEYTIGLTYLEYLAALPWHRTTEDNLDLARAERILDEHHYGLGQVKERILEHLAIKALRRRRQPRVLAVDDDETARRNLVLALAREGCEVVTAASSREALEQLEAREFDLVLTDLKLGQSDGMELLERSRDRWPDTRVVVITGYATIPSAVEAVKKGAFQYLAKPYAIDELRSTVRRALEGRALLKGTKGSVLCFAGPPGTGKTSVGRSIAQALWADVRTHQPRGDARRGGHPGPPPHLRRRQAGPRDRGDPARRVSQPGVHARRTRQDRPGLQGRPGVGAARGARPGAERRLPRPLSRRALRPFGGALHRHGQSDAIGARGAARPAGGHRVPRLHRGGEGADRRALPLPEATAGEGTDERSGLLHAGGDHHDYPRVHPGGGDSQPRAAHRHRLPQDRPRESWRRRRSPRSP